MLRHLKNFNELVLYAVISCGAAFFVRMLPQFFLVVMLLRLCILGYSAYIIWYLEDNAVLGWCLAAATIIGLIGGNFDWIELQFQFNQGQVITMIALAIGLPMIAAALYLQHQGGNRNA